MKKQNYSTTNPAKLHQKAVALLKNKKPVSASQLSEVGMMKLIHELEVHQIELELQNEELMLARSLAQNLAEKYIDLFDFATVGYFTLSKEGNIIELNLTGAQMLCKKRSRLKNSQFGFFVSNGTKPIFNLFLEKIFNSNTRESCEVNLVTNGNMSRYVYITGIITANGEQCLVTVVDMTAYRKAENALRDSKQWLSTMYNTITDVIFYLKVETSGHYRFISVNQSFCNFTGLSEEMVVENLVNEIIPEPSLGMMLGKYRQAIEEKTLVRWEETFDYPTRHLIGEVSVSPIFDDTGRCTHLLGSIHDITEHKLAEKSLYESERKLKEAQRIGKIGNWEFDFSTNKIKWSDQVFKLYERDMELGPPTVEEEAKYYTKEQAKMLSDFANHSIEKGLEFNIDIEPILPSGRKVHYSSTIHPVKDENEKVIKLFGTIHDITELKKVEEYLKQKVIELERMNQFMVNRETKMIELKKEINLLHTELGRSEKYDAPKKIDAI